MRLRHLALIGFIVAIAGGLVSCDLMNSVSIDQRITDFQSDLNSSNWSNAYNNFHPDQTSDYGALKSGTKTLAVAFVARTGSDPNYSLTITDKSNSNAVLVTVNGGPATFGAPRYLKLKMDTTGSSDYRIVTLEIDNGSGVFLGTPQIQ